MPDITSSMKEDKKGPKNREITPGLGYSKNTGRNKKLNFLLLGEKGNPKVAEFHKVWLGNGYVMNENVQ